MIEVLEIPMYDEDIISAVQLITGRISNNFAPENLCISATGAHGLVEASKNPFFKKVLQSFYLNLPDGMPTVWVGRWKGASRVKRCYGPDFFAEFMSRTAGNGITHFFCGGKEGVARELQAVCSKTFGNTNVVGVYSPPFREISEEEIQVLGQRITASGAQIIWIGLSTPKQEIFASRLAQYTQSHFIITVGAAFDFHTGKLKQAPRWMQKTGMEWFFRLLAEPRRLYRRYFEIVPRFVYLNIREFAHICIHKLGG